MGLGGMIPEGFLEEAMFKKRLEWELGRKGGMA